MTPGALDVEASSPKSQSPPDLFLVRRLGLGIRAGVLRVMPTSNDGVPREGVEVLPCAEEVRD